MRERKRLRNRICDLLSDPIFEKVKSLPPFFQPYVCGAPSDGQ
jgi:hypothetical protein